MSFSVNMDFDLYHCEGRKLYAADATLHYVPSKVVFGKFLVDIVFCTSFVERNNAMCPQWYLVVLALCSYTSQHRIKHAEDHRVNEERLLV